MDGRVLIVAGSDSGGGAGIQGDLKSVTALNGFAATAITALTAQNTQGVFGVFPVAPDFITQQIDLVLDDIGADAIKTGMLGNETVIDTVVAAFQSRPGCPPIVVDPVMVAKGGAALLEPEAATALRTRLLPLASVITPNIPEAETLLGHPIPTVADMEGAAYQLRAMGPEAVLLKGGHMESGDGLVHDLLITAEGVTRFSSTRLATTSTHGTGCALASAVATGLAQGLPLAKAVARAREYVREAIRTAPGFGQGHGPLNHAHTVQAG